MGYEPGGDGPSTIVVGVDGSATSERALYYAFGLARREHTTVVAVYATVPTPLSDTFGATTLVATDQSLYSELKSTVATLAADYRVRARLIIAVGDPAAVLGRIAHEHRADAIVLGTSTSILHRFFGSTAVRLIKHCGCPVTVVP